MGGDGGGYYAGRASTPPPRGWPAVIVLQAANRWRLSIRALVPVAYSRPRLLLFSAWKKEAIVECQSNNFRGRRTGFNSSEAVQEFRLNSFSKGFHQNDFEDRLFLSNFSLLSLSDTQ